MEKKRSVVEAEQENAAHVELHPVTDSLVECLTQPVRSDGPDYL
jgi:hypothetical protein